MNDWHYETLTPQERFALMIEAMARRDDVEADRLEDTCPRRTYRAEDAEFRDRMRRAHSIAMMVCLNMRAGLARMRMARAFRETAGEFAAGAVKAAQIVFLYGREYGMWEAGVIEQIDLPDRAKLEEEIAANPDLTRQIEELREGVAETIEQVTQVVHESVGRSDALDLLSQWEGFTRFCRGTLGVEALKLVRAYGLPHSDPAAEIVAVYADGAPVEAEAARWTEQWTKSWKKRFDTIAN